MMISMILQISNQLIEILKKKISQIRITSQILKVSVLYKHGITMFKRIKWILIAMPVMLERNNMKQMLKKKMILLNMIQMNLMQKSQLKVCLRKVNFNRSRSQGNNRNRILIIMIMSSWLTRMSLMISEKNKNSCFCCCC